MSKLMPEQRQELEAITNLPDDQVDFSDIPEIRELPPDYVIGFANRPKKVDVTIRLDSDVAAWLEAAREGGQVKINYHLRELMRQQQRL